MASVTPTTFSAFVSPLEGKSSALRAMDQWNAKLKASNLKPVQAAILEPRSGAPVKTVKPPGCTIDVWA